MGYITDKKRYTQTIERFAEKKISMALFCTASHWNTEAILLACKKMSEHIGVEKIPVAVGVTYSYKNMAQCERVTYSKDHKSGFLSLMAHLNILCGKSDSPYFCIDAYPHLDHADPVRDVWPLTAGTEYLASVMFDAQQYDFKDNTSMTSEYVKKYGNSLMIEGIIDQLSVLGKYVAEKDDYESRAYEYIKKTGVDFLVADLGTEQQSDEPGKCEYKRERARNLTRILNSPRLVLHGTSCMTEKQMEGLGEDGVIRVNMWTRIAREAGQYAAKQITGRIEDINAGSFEACDSKKYIYDSIEKASDIMFEVLKILGYEKLA